MDNAERLRPRVLCKRQHDENQHPTQAVRSIQLELLIIGVGLPRAVGVRLMAATLRRSPTVRVRPGQYAEKFLADHPQQFLREIYHHSGYCACRGKSS